MKKVLLSLAVVAALGMTSCGSESKESENKSDSDMLCECAAEMMSYSEDMNSDDEEKMMEASKKMGDKMEECEKIAKKMEEGKSEDEIKKMRNDFEKNCDALKGMK
jgi:hypothetical protein